MPFVAPVVSLRPILVAGESNRVPICLLLFVFLYRSAFIPADVFGLSFVFAFCSFVPLMIAVLDTVMYFSSLAGSAWLDTSTKPTSRKGKRP